VTIAYRWNRDAKEATYGATIFRRSSLADPMVPDKHQAWVKKHHVQTALGRLARCPVVVKGVPPEIEAHKDLEKFLRAEVRRRGARGSRPAAKKQ